MFLNDLGLINPSNAEATFVQSTRMQSFEKPSKTCHVGIHWKALAEYLDAQSSHGGRMILIKEIYEAASAKYNKIIYQRGRQYH